MATVKKSYDAHKRKIDANGVTLSNSVDYLVSGLSTGASADPEAEALQAVLNVAPSYVGEADLDYIEISERLTESVFKVTAVYTKSDGGGGEEDTEPTASFSCGGGTKKVISAISQTIHTTDTELEALNPAGKLIEYDPSTKQASGCEVPCADLHETYTKVMSYSQLTTAWKRKVAAVVGCVNSSTFKGWDAGTVMFLGCSYTGSKGSKVTVSYDFSIRNDETVDFGGGAGEVTKKGWEYAWPLRYNTGTSAEGAAKAYVAAVYTAKVCNEADFNTLGL